MNRPKLANKYECTGCLACVDACRQGAIKGYINSEGHYSYEVDESKCVQCHMCEKVCPSISGFEYGSNELTKSDVNVSWSLDNKLRATSTSGGIFSTLAKNVLEEGGVVIGAMQEQYLTKHCLIDNVNDLSLLQGSKYTQSNTEGIFREVKTQLAKGKKVLFSGLGCQVAALLSFLKKDKHIDNLLTVDLICGGVPSSFLITKYVEHTNIESILSYRNKRRYVLTVKTKSGIKKSVPKNERPLPICGFTTGATNRYSCYDCKFAKGHRKSDITIGDYWGQMFEEEEKQKGLSVTIAHSIKGVEALDAVNIAKKQIEWNDVLLTNPRIVCGHAHIPSERKKLENAFATYSFEKILELYANKGTWKRPWTMIKRVVRIFIYHYYKNVRKRDIYKILKDNNL